MPIFWEISYFEYFEEMDNNLILYKILRTNQLDLKLFSHATFTEI